MKKNQIIYKNGDIEVTKRNVFGKIGLAAHNEKNKATATAFVETNAEIPAKIEKLIYEVKKDTIVDLTPKLIKIEENYLQEVFGYDKN